MKPITREWVKKAEKDWVAAQVLHRQRKETQHDLVCFLSQQCAEKYLKARLKHAGSPVRRTHDLLLLLKAVMTAESAWGVLTPLAKALSEYAVDSRYPGKSATKAEAQQALKDCDEIRQAVRAALGLLPD